MNKKTEISIRLHEEIIRKEMVYSEDLRNKERIKKAEDAIEMIKRVFQ